MPNQLIDNNDKAGPSTLDETLIESQKSDSKTEMETGNPVFDNNENGKGEIPSTLDEGKTGNVKRKRIRCIKRGICTLEGTLDF